MLYNNNNNGNDNNNAKGNNRKIYELYGQLFQSIPIPIMNDNGEKKNVKLSFIGFFYTINQTNCSNGL